MARCFTLLGTSLAENFITIFITTRRNREVLRTFNLHYANEESIKVKGLWGGGSAHPATPGSPPPSPARVLCALAPALTAQAGSRAELHF